MIYPPIKQPRASHVNNTSQTHVLTNNQGLSIGHIFTMATKLVNDASQLIIFARFKNPGPSVPSSALNIQDVSPILLRSGKSHQQCDPRLHTCCSFHLREIFQLLIIDDRLILSVNFYCRSCLVLSAAPSSALKCSVAEHSLQSSQRRMFIPTLSTYIRSTWHTLIIPTAWHLPLPSTLLSIRITLDQ